ncbi:MAG: hypothetical protein ACJ76H_15705 [Bacteriovoracaceae bacterium]
MKNNNLNSQVPAEKSSYSTGTRGESAGARNKSGNHTGERVGSPRRPKTKH